MSNNTPTVDPRLPVKLVPVQIPKPWGQEIWFTGIEERGESGVELDGEVVPISTYLRSGDALTAGQDLLLLKILDPQPTEILGDLYFEVHEEKREVYVVTHVDQSAWPDGTGAIRFGMDQNKRREYADDAAFRAAYLHAVQNYEMLRRQIDEGQLDAQAVAAEEADARAEMESFTASRPLRTGDVVAVPTWTPHSLQHGVRVVEFQTATYERYIVSFAQQVLTQDHWDSEHAIAHMHLDTPASPEFDPVQPGVERIARFDHFNVWRASAATLTLPSHIPYGVLINVTGTTRVGPLTLGAEDACFVPAAGVGGTTIRSDGQYLLAAPGL